MGKKKKSKKPTRKEEVENSCIVFLEEKDRHSPRNYGFNKLKFNTRKEAEIARSIFKIGIETDKDELAKLTALVYKHGILFDNEWEIRFARLLEKNGILFRYGKTVKTKRIPKSEKVVETPTTSANDGHIKVRPSGREIDFTVLTGPIRVRFRKNPIQYFEIKSGGLNLECCKQQRELRDAGYDTDIARKEDIMFWEEYGFLEPETDHIKPNLPEYHKPECMLQNAVPKNESHTKHGLAQILLADDIEFEYYEDEKDCPPNRDCHRVLYVLRVPSHGFWCNEDVQIIMLIEGKFTPEDEMRWKIVSNKFRTLIAGRVHVVSWQMFGFLKQRT